MDVFFKDGVWLHGRGETNDTRVNQSLIEMNTRTLQRGLKNEDISRGGTEKQNKMTTTSGTPSTMFSISRRDDLPTIVTSASFLSINYERL